MPIFKETCPDLPDGIQSPIDFGFHLMEVQNPELLREKLVDITQGQKGYEKMEQALALAFEAHENQSRFENKPYVVHPLRGALRLIQYYHQTGNGLPPADYIYIALLHDTLEDSRNVSPETIKTTFGDFVHDGVQLLTKYRGEGATKTRVDDRTYFANIRNAPAVLAPAVQIIKVIDRIDNTASLTNLVSFPGDPSQFIHEQLTETRQYIAPIAQQFPLLCHELRDAVSQAKKYEGHGIRLRPPRRARR